MILQALVVAADIAIILAPLFGIRALLEMRQLRQLAKRRASSWIFALMERIVRLCILASLPLALLGLAALPNTINENTPNIRLLGLAIAIVVLEYIPAVILRELRRPRVRPVA